MKRITLLSLILTNFQGGTYTLETGGRDISVLGDNGTGKTRNVSAYTWLLFGSDSLGRTKFQIKNTNAAGEEAHREENSVKGIFEIEEDSVKDNITLKKVHKERYANKRSRGDEEFTGNTIDHFVNGVPASKKVFTDLVEKYFGDEERYRMISTPTAFPALTETRQRELLIEVGGGITDAEVIATDNKLSELPALLGDKNVEDRKKQVEGRQKEIKDKEKGLPSIRTRIDENKNNLPDISHLIKEEIEYEISHLKEIKDSKNTQLLGIDNGSRIAELGKSLETSKVDIRAIETEHYDKQMAIFNSLNQTVDVFNNKKSRTLTELTTLKSDIDIKQLRVTSLIEKIEECQKESAKINSRKFEAEIETKCFNCGADIDESLVEENRNAALATFNRTKAVDLQKVNEEYTALQNSIDKAKYEQTALQLQYNEKQATIDTTTDIAKIIEERDAAKLQAKIITLPRHKQLRNTIEDIEKQIEEEKKGTTIDKAPIESEIEKLDADLKVQNDLLGLFDDHAKGMTRIDELKESEKTLNAEYEQLEKELFLINLFIHKKIELLDTKINGLFSHVRFKLFDVLNDGTLKPCCVFMGDGIPHGKGLNNAAELVGGLDICKTLGKFYGISAPAWVDNAEAITVLPKMDCQVIRLVVSEKDKALRIEHN